MLNSCNNCSGDNLGTVCNKVLIINSNFTAIKNKYNNNDHYKKNLEGLINIKENFTSEYQNVITTLTQIIEKISSTTKESKEDEEESPASKVTMLNLSWMRDSQVEGNFLRINTTKSCSYWIVKSEEVLDWPFVCKIVVVNIQSTTGYWNHSAGIIKENQINSDDTYYNDSLVYQSNGYAAVAFSSSGGGQKISESWKTNDIVFIKRDSENNVYMGLNDETNLVLAFPKIEGRFRIYMAFSSSSRSDEFRLDYLQNH